MPDHGENLDVKNMEEKGGLTDDRGGVVWHSKCQGRCLQTLPVKGQTVSRTCSVGCAVTVNCPALLQQCVLGF